MLRKGKTMEKQIQWLHCPVLSWCLYQEAPAQVGNHGHQNLTQGERTLCYL
jgi:hypothetical protein